MTTGQRTAVLTGSALGFVAVMLAVALPVRWSGLDCGTPIFRNVSDLRDQQQEADDQLSDARREDTQGSGQLEALNKQQVDLLERQSALFEESAKKCAARLNDRSVLLGVLLLVGLGAGVVGFRLFAEQEGRRT